MLTRICTFVLILGCVCCLLISIPVTAKEWRGIVPLHSTRADVRKLLGKPHSEESPSSDLYEVAEGRVDIMYVREKCEQGLPANWGNWNVPPDTVVNISISLNKPIPLTELGVPNIKRFEWYTDDSSTTYYHDKKQGIEYEVQDKKVTSITYGPTEKDSVLLCNKNAPVIRY
jgi:hypothetical protein